MRSPFLGQRKSAGRASPVLRRSRAHSRIDRSHRPNRCFCVSATSSPNTRKRRSVPFGTGRRAGCQKTHGELERAEALSIFNRARRRVRRVRGDFCGGKSHFPEQKSLPCSFCARKSERFQQKLVGVAGRLKTQRVFRFCLWQNCHGSNRRFEARHLAGELAPPSTSLSKRLF